MRMRLRTNAFERLAACGKWFIPTFDDTRNVNETLAERAYFDFPALFGQAAPVDLEIGCGQGKFACDYALQHPDRNLLAVERVSNVILSGAERACNDRIENVRFLRGKAECLPKYVPENSISKIFLLFSTPLPKEGYKKQRLTSPRFLQIYRRLLQENGEIYQKTDDEAFYRYSLAMLSENGFTIVFHTDNLHENGERGIVTEYERKFIDLGKPIYAIVARKEEPCTH